MKYDIKSMYLSELESFLKDQGYPGFRSKQLFEWIHVKKVRSYFACKNLPSDLINKLDEISPLVSLKTVLKQTDSQDGTIKYLFELSDHHVVETVLMKYKYGNSLCISSQVGCRMGCTFCASTLKGLIRNLLPSEMLDQIYAVEADINEAIHSVVVMGTGEPFDNYDHFIRFVNLLSDEKGRNLSRRHITVSTCGLVDKIHSLIQDAPQINLAISLHATRQADRRSVMPIAQKYDLTTLLEACRHYTDMTKRRITFEYSLIDGVNDSKEAAQELAHLLKGMLCHVNLIPVNPVDEKNQRPSSDQHVQQFKRILEQNQIQTTLRRSLGQEIDAACGQLRNRYIDQP